jgi:hypothetical protein
MPSPRAILADITDLGLHPEEHHSVTRSDGRLKVMNKTLPVTLTPTVETPRPNEVQIGPVVVELETPVTEVLSVETETVSCDLTPVALVAETDVAVTEPTQEQPIDQQTTTETLVVTTDATDVSDVLANEPKKKQQGKAR